MSCSKTYKEINGEQKYLLKKLPKNFCFRGLSIVFPLHYTFQVSSYALLNRAIFDGVHQWKKPLQKHLPLWADAFFRWLILQILIKKLSI